MSRPVRPARSGAARAPGLAVLALAAVAVLTLATQVASAAGVGVVEAGSGVFPDRAYVLTLPSKRTITAADISVTEDGRAVEGVTVVPSNSEGGIGTVLLIDASNSMRRSIDQAMAAARSFAGKNPGQAISVVTFNSRPSVVLPFTFDTKLIAKTLSSTPALAEGTHIYDALAAAAAQIRDANLGAGRVVLLSDGDDVGSITTADSAIGQLDAESVRAFTVGIKSADFFAEDLQRIADDTGGTYAEAGSPNALKPIFAQLGFKASNEYLLRYRSNAGPGESIDLAVTVKGIPGVSEVSYDTPESGSGGPYAPQFKDKALQSWPVLLAVVAMVIGLVLFALQTLLRLRSNRALRRRLGDFVTVDVDEKAEARKREVALMLASAGEQSSRWRNTDWFRRFELDSDVAQIKMTPHAMMLWSVAAALLVAIVLGVFFSPILSFAGLLVPFFARGEVTRRARKARLKFQEQLDDNLEVLGSALRAGHSLVGAMNVVVDEAPEPSKTELRKVVTDEQLGISLDEALEVTARRMDSTDMDQVAVLAMLQREAGGNMAEVLDQVIDNIRAREELRRLVRTLTAQGRMARWIVSLIPVGLIIVISLINPSQLDPLFHKTAGQIGLVVATILVIVGSFVIKKIIEIEL